MSKKVSNIEKLNQSKEKLEETLRSRLGRVIVVRFICLGNHLKSIAVHELWSKKVSNIEKLDQSKEKLEKKLCEADWVGWWCGDQLGGKAGHATSPGSPAHSCIIYRAYIIYRAV